jgi:hypothetical protein
MTYCANNVDPVDNLRNFLIEYIPNYERQVTTSQTVRFSTRG